MSGTLFHLVSQGEWEAAKKLGRLAPPSLAAQGFVHLSEERQVLGTANRFFAGRNDLLLLRIDPALLADPVRYEEGEPGVLFPHLYGALPLAAVVAVLPLVPDSDGHFFALP